MSEPGPGTVAEEAARLLRALQDVAAGWQPKPAEAEAPPTACQVCPVCQGIAAVQRLRPETVQHLADAAASLTAALAGIVGGRPPQPTEQDGSVARPRQGDEVERIDITD